MFGSTVIDIALGLIFIYFLLSVAASHINEVIASLVQARAKNLEAGVRTLLADPNLSKQVMSHPLISGLSGQVGRLPSYIPSATFALALFDTILPAGEQSPNLEAVRKQVAQMPESSARRALLSMIDKADGDMSKARQGVEDWFNAGMDRVTGVYKRWIQQVTFVVALAITLILGVDTLALANSLWQQPALRAALATQASQTTPTITTVQSTGAQDALKALASANLPIAWQTVPQTVGEWFQKVIGLLLTTLAVSLGAPFWFDLLKNLANLRSSGPPPKSS